MQKRLGLLLFIVLFYSAYLQAEEKINWQTWSDAQFARAKKENKLVYLNLEAVWCHWCHVMEKETYSKKEVIEILNKSFIAIKVDQDSYPDLSVRYRDYGWPATIIFNSSGEEIEKLSGFIKADELSKTLINNIKNPKPRDSKGAIDLQYTEQTTLDKGYKDRLIDKHYSSLDMEIGGLKTVHKFLDFETVEYAMIMAASGSEKDRDFAKLSLNSNLKIIDPIWGGAYQYSARGDWDHPHYEKIMQSQVENIKLYSYAYSLWGDESYWTSATGIYRYLKNFLTSPEGAFYTSQDADVKKGEHSKEFFKLSDEERRKVGVPSVDKNIYARENGWVISALSALYAATGNQAMLDDALKSLNYVEANYLIEGRGFKHAKSDNAGNFLSDNISMASAYLNLYMVSADKSYLKKAEETAAYIGRNFSDGIDSVPGFYSTKPNTGTVLKPFKDLTENLQTTRFLNILFHYTGKKEYKDLATKGMQYLASPVVTGNYVNYSGILTADLEFNRDPLHVTIVGHKDDPASMDLFNAGLKYFSPYKRLEWWDKREGSMPNPDVEYPQMPKAAAFVCTNKRCSLPIFKADDIAKTIKLFHKDEK